MEAELAYRRAMDFANSPTVRSAAREFVYLLADKNQFREAAEIHTTAGLEPPSGISEVDYYIGRLQQDDNSKQAAAYFIDKIKLMQHWFEIEKQRDKAFASSTYRKLDDTFGHRYHRGTHDREKAKLRAKILSGDPDAAPRAAYDFGELLEQEGHSEQAQGAFE
jgi:hypothetical protein